MARRPNYPATEQLGEVELAELRERLCADAPPPARNLLPLDPQRLPLCEPSAIVEIDTGTGAGVEGAEAEAIGLAARGENHAFHLALLEDPTSALQATTPNEFND